MQWEPAQDALAWPLVLALLELELALDNPSALAQVAELVAELVGPLALPPGDYCAG